MTDQQPTDPVTPDAALAPAVAKDLEKFAQATNVARGLQNTRDLRKAARQGGEE